MAFGADESVLFIEVFLIQRCANREAPLYIIICDVKFNLLHCELVDTHTFLYHRREVR